MTETVERCPECDRPLGLLPPFYELGACVGRLGPMYRPDCMEHTIARLRAELATLREREKFKTAVNESTCDLRVFHLSGELRAVSKEAQEHAEARAGLSDELERVRTENARLTLKADELQELRGVYRDLRVELTESERLVSELRAELEKITLATKTESV